MVKTDSSKNPFVDGMENIAIPDSRYGVVMNGIVVNNIYAIGSIIWRDMSLKNISVNEALKFSEIRVQGNIELQDSRFNGKFEFDDALVTGFLELSGAIGKKIYMKELNVHNGVLMDRVYSEEVDLSHGGLKGVDFSNAVTEGNFSLETTIMRGLTAEKSRISGTLNLKGANANYIDLKDSYVEVIVAEGLKLAGNLDLRGTTIKTCKSLKRMKIGAYLMDDNTKIPGKLEDHLEKYCLRKIS